MRNLWRCWNFEDLVEGIDGADGCGAEGHDYGADVLALSEACSRALRSMRPLLSVGTLMKGRPRTLEMRLWV